MAGNYIKTEDHKRKIGEANSISLKGRKLSKTHIDNIKLATIKRIKEDGFGFQKGNSHSERWKEMKKTQIGENSPNWKGDKVGYWGVHDWIQKKLGKPKKCEHCGKIGMYNYRKNGVKVWNIQWANKTGKYLRDINDWLQLCSKCHSEYDKKFVIEE